MTMGRPRLQDFLLLGLVVGMISLHSADGVVRIEIFQFRRLVKGPYFMHTTKQAEPEIDFATIPGFFTTSSTWDTRPLVTAAICPKGWQFSKGLCSQSVDETANKTCPQGYTKSQSQCTQFANPTCPPGYLLDVAKCILLGQTDLSVESANGPATERCPNDYERIGKMCYEKCQPGYKRFYSNLCISRGIECPRGFTKVGSSECLLTECPLNMVLSDLNCETACPMGFTRRLNYCESSTATCPANFNKEGDLCKLKFCPKGQVMLEGAGCVNENFTPCPENFTFSDTVCRKCKVPNAEQCPAWENRCPNGWWWMSSEKCTSICPSGFAALGQNCVDIASSNCPEGHYHLKGQGCVQGTSCPEGYTMISRECVPVEKEKCAAYTLNGKCYDSCPSGFVEHEHTCIKMTSEGKCPSAFTQLEDQVCVTTCPNGFTAVGKHCMPSPWCEEGEYNFKGNCTKKCPDGYKVFEEKRLCKLDPTYCPAGKVRLDSVCIEPTVCTNKNNIVDNDFRVCLKSPTCPGSLYYFGDYCLKECPVSYEPYIGVCKKKSETSCPNGVLFNGKCQPNCPDGYIPKRGVCIESSTEIRECGVNQQAVKCDSSEECSTKCICNEGFIQRPGQEICVLKELKCPSKHPLDVVLVIDGSKYVTEKDFSLVKLFLVESISQIFSAKTDVRVGIIVIGVKQPKIIYLHELTKDCDTTRVITSIEREEGGDLSIVDGLRIARKLVLNQCDGARLGVAKQIYVIAFERQFTTDINERLKEEIQLQILAGHRCAFITIGNIKELPANVYSLNVEDVGKLTKYSPKLADIACRDMACPAGYKLDGTACKDIDECLENPCHTNAICLNEPGKYTCFCPPGVEYIDKQIGCGEKPECDTKMKGKDICSVVTCVGGANCTSHNGLGFCSCPRGYAYQEGKGCVDFDECTLSPCLDNATCTNGEGFFNCTCPAGYKYDKHFGCVDIDECVVLTSPCSGNGKCENVKGSYNCICQKGYEYILNVGCKDINECLIKDPCVGENVRCDNTEGSFRCVCDQGFEYSESGCKDIDECQTLGETACPRGALCTNQLGGYNCTCQKGFYYNQQEKECKLNTDSNTQQIAADLVFAVDASKRITQPLFDSVVSLAKDIITDYKVNTITINKRFSALVAGGESSTEVAFTGLKEDMVLNRTDSMKYKGGEISIPTTLKDSRQLYEKNGQANSSRLVFFLTGTKPNASDANEVAKIKAEVANIKKTGQLLIIYVGPEVSISDWAVIFPQDELEKHVIAVTLDFIKSIHTLIYSKSDRLITCPEGFIFLDSVCQYKTHNTAYCKWDDKLYAINSTWTSECSQVQCTAKGVVVLKTECMGYDGSCYQVGEFFPCTLEGKINWRCKCNVSSYLEKETGHYQQKIVYTVIYFDREAAVAETQTESGTPCSFPFKFNDKWSYACTDQQSTTRWCSHTTLYQKNYSYCKRTVVQQCVMEGKVYPEGSQWSVGCNDLYCTAGALSITAKCETAEKKCVQLMTENYPCVINDRRYEKCICTQDSFGYGKNAAIGGAFTGNEGSHKSGLTTYCEQRTTGERREVGQEWTQDCFKLRCESDGSTAVLQKQCSDKKGSCQPKGATGFPCMIKDRHRDKCSCEVEGNTLILTALEKGEKVSEAVNETATENVSVVKKLA